MLQRSYIKPVILPILAVFILAFFAVYFLGGYDQAEAQWLEPSSAPPIGNVAPPLRQDTQFSGQVQGKWDEMKIQIDNCTGTDNFLTWEDSSLVCSGVEQVIESINNYYEDNTEINNPLAGRLIDVLENGPDASDFSGNVMIGSTTSISNLYLAGGEIKSKWLHSTEPGNNSFVGNVLLGGNLGIGTTKDPGLPLQIEERDLTVGLAGKYWSPNYNYANKELFNILAKVGTVNSVTWGDSVAGKISFIGVTNNHIPKTDIAFASTPRYNEAPKEHMRITGDGNLGLGTSTPTALLHLFRAGGQNAEVSIQSVTGTGNHWGIYQDRGTGELRFWNNQSDNLLVLKKAGVLSLKGSLELLSTAPADKANKLYSASGNLYWNGKAVGRAVFAGLTTQTLKGNSGGYSGMNDKCNASFVGSHLCTNEEILDLINNNPDSIKNQEYVWVSKGVVDAQANDCSGWTSDLSRGAIWDLRSEVFTAFITACNAKLRAACCY